MKEIKRFKTPDGKEYVAFRAPNGNIIVALDPDAYQDIVSMPATITTSFAVKIYNYTIATLYFTVIGSGAPWSWASAVQLGACASGANIIIHVPNLGTRSKPAAATVDGITLTFHAYSNAGYTVEVGSGYPVVVSYHWIDSTAMTLLDLDNFDGGTLEGWAAITSGGPALTFAINTGYVLSSPNSAMVEIGTVFSPYTVVYTEYIYKSFIVPAASIAYLIANVKYALFSHWSDNNTSFSNVQELQIRKAGAIIQRSGPTPYIAAITGLADTDVNVQTNWLRMVAPISVNATAQYEIATVYQMYSGGSSQQRLRVYHDDLKVVYA